MWDCIHCGKEIEDSLSQRVESLRSRYVLGEMVFCLDCANELVNRNTGKLKHYPTDLSQLSDLIKRKENGESSG